jgi:hypothetical protein
LKGRIKEGQEMATGEPNKTTGKGMLEKGKEIQTRRGQRKN